MQASVAADDIRRLYSALERGWRDTLTAAGPAIAGSDLGPGLPVQLLMDALCATDPEYVGVEGRLQR